MQDKPLRKLYTSLKSNNYDVPDNYESFERTLTESGKLVLKVDVPYMSL